jgi:FlaA1/EpsC-like NDP-sugar epimerase
MQLIPMSSPDLTAAEVEAVNQVLHTPYLSLGPRLAEFEERFAATVGARYAVGVNSGTSGLHLAVIADIRDQERTAWIFRTWRPGIVFHAAAHKHVPLMECNAIEAVTNNILGTRNVVRAAEGANVERLVMISTDKAVQPVSVMGVSKLIAEMVVQETARRIARPYVAVRFGNVLGSRGSVIPLFKEQIKAGGPVTVTHPEMTRYFMTIPEAVLLVLQAGALGVGGEVFVLDMGQPIKVLDLAKDLIELSGLKPYDDIEIVFTGIRPGEKLHEMLFYPDEAHTRTVHEKILVAQNGRGEMLEGLDEAIDCLEQLAHDQRETEILEVLGKILADSRTAGAIRAKPGDGKYIVYY